MVNKTKKIEISQTEARRFLIHYQGLDTLSTIDVQEGILKYIKKVGCIQYDPLNVVGRNHDLVLQSRIKDYSPSFFEKMLYTDRSVIDGWDKMMSIYLREDWTFFNRLRKQREKELRRILEHRNSLEALNLTAEIHRLLVLKGPLQSTQINVGAAGKSRWGHRNLSGAAMDYMFNIGELGIHKKKSTQKIYNLIENLLPEKLLNAPDPFTCDRDFYKWYFKRRIGSIGLLWERNGGGWLGQFISDQKLRHSVLLELEEEKSLISLSIKGIDEPFFMRQEDLKLLDLPDEPKEPQIRFLAPLDNLLWDREMIEKIFNFKYSWEVYLPKEKRKFGYYVLPVLYGDRIIARFEPEKHTAENPLKIKNWWWEDGIVETNKIKSAVKKGINLFNEYLKVDTVKQTYPYDREQNKKYRITNDKS